MLRVNTRSGTTLAYELLDSRELADWQYHSALPDFQRDITGVSLIHLRTFHTLQVPQGFEGRAFEAQVVRDRNGLPVAVQASCLADDVRLSLTVYLTSGQARVDMAKVVSSEARRFVVGRQ